jgi:hypothetical protein
MTTLDAGAEVKDLRARLREVRRQVHEGPCYSSWLLAICDLRRKDWRKP